MPPPHGLEPYQLFRIQQELAQYCAMAHCHLDPNIFSTPAAPLLRFLPTTLYHIWTASPANHSHIPSGSASQVLANHAYLIWNSLHLTFKPTTHSNLKIKFLQFDLYFFTFSQISFTSFESLGPFNTFCLGLWRSDTRHPRVQTYYYIHRMASQTGCDSKQVATRVATCNNRLTI